MFLQARDIYSIDGRKKAGKRLMELEFPNEGVKPKKKKGWGGVGHGKG